MPLLIYFAGSIRGAPPDRATYGALIDELSTHGTVLTEHVRLADDERERLTDADIHARQMKWLRSSDVVVAEVSTASLGVGYEIAWAEVHDKPILCLYEPAPDRRMSAMLAGNPKVVVKPYRSLVEAGRAIREFLASAGLSP